MLQLALLLCMRVLADPLDIHRQTRLPVVLACPIGQYLVSLIVEKQRDTCVRYLRTRMVSACEPYS